jgi:hypothetical protein
MLEDIGRWRLNLIGNIEGAIQKLRNTHLDGNELNLLFGNCCNYLNGNGFNTELYNKDLLDKISGGRKST